MRAVWALVMGLMFFSAQCTGQFFPKHALDLQRGKFGDFKAQWYSHQLEALQEPSLFKLAADKSVESYRFLLLRSFHHPVAIRVDVSADGTAVLTAKTANGAGGYRPGVLIENTTRKLRMDEVQLFLQRVKDTGFWNAPNPVNDQNGSDGSQWVIEGVKNGCYHVVDRWSPTRGVAHDLGMMLAFQLAGLKIPENELY